MVVTSSYKIAQHLLDVTITIFKQNWLHEIKIYLRVKKIKDKITAFDWGREVSFCSNIRELKTTTKFMTKTSVDWERTGTRTSVSAGKRKLEDAEGR